MKYVMQYNLRILVAIQNYKTASHQPRCSHLPDAATECSCTERQHRLHQWYSASCGSLNDIETLTKLRY